MMRWKWWLVLGLLLGMGSSIVAFDPNVTFLINDSVCDRTQNETRLNSHDCPLSAGQVWTCAMDESACVDAHLFRDLTIGLFVVIAGLLAWRFKDRVHKPAAQDRYRKVKSIRRGT